MKHMMARLWHHVPFWLLILLVFSGCNNRDAWKARPYPAQGQVIINGAPPPGAVLLFHATSKEIDVRETKPFAIVKEDGTYQVRTYKSGDGLPAGEYRVTLRWETRSGANDDRLGFAYTDPEKSQWTFTVKKGKNELPLIELKDVKVQGLPGSAPAEQGAQPPEETPASKE